MPAKPVTHRRTFANLVQIAVWAYTAFIFAWWLGRWAWGDRVWLLAVLNSFPACLFAPLPLVVGLAALSRRRMTWAAASAPVLLWLVLFGWRFLPHPPRVEATDAELRVMAFNVLYTNEDVDSIVAAIRAVEPDLIALPELRPGTDIALAAQLDSTYPYHTLQTLPAARFGTGIYSRWPLTSLGSLQTGLGLRSAVADVDTPMGAVRFVALHPWATLAAGRSFDEVRGNIQQAFRSRERQVAAICSYLDRWGDRPVILAGDFNLSEFSDAYRCLAERLRDGYREAGWGYGHTWPEGRSDQPPFSLAPWLPGLARIDYVFHSRHWRAVDASVLKMPTGSDHRPIIITLRWIGDQQAASD